MEYKVNKIKHSPELAQYKIKNWCAYQERSQHETRQKLYEYGLFSEQVEQIIAALIEENFLNEERFALALVSGKFKIKQWGKNKIKVELKKHRISDYLIGKALESIDLEEYEKTMVKIIEKRIRLNKKDKPQVFFYSCIKYLISRGFESNLATEVLNNRLVIK